MAQHDYTIANQGFPATRADINNALSAIATNNSGTSAPSTQYAGQFWIDTTSSTWTLYIHDGTDDIQFATIDTSTNTVNFVDSALDVVTDTTPQLGGNLDLNSNDITGTGDINITGTITATSFSGDGSSLTGLSLVADTTPQLGGMLDVNGQSIGDGTLELIKFSETASAVNEITVTNSATGNAPQISATGDDTNIDLRLNTKGTGGVVFNAGAVATPSITTSGDTNTGIFFPSADTIAFTEGGTEAMRINSDGNVALAKNIGLGGATPTTSGTGITFPASASASTDANTLDDYEEGTWTPILVATGATFAYSLQLGKYTKIGKTVILHGRVSLTSSSGGSGAVKISDLPFTVADAISGNNFGNQGIIGRATSFSGDTPNSLEAVNSATDIQIWYRTSSNGGTAELQFNDLGNSASFLFTVVYESA